MIFQNIFLTIGLLACFAGARYFECYECQSDIDPDCAIRPGKQIDVTKCPSGDKCVVMVATDGTTHRGCYSSLISNGYCPSKTCKACDTPLCNEEIFPSNRLKCYQCSSGTDCINITLNYVYKPLPCQYYAEEGQCYTDIIDTKKIERGCVTMQEKSKKCANICLKCNYDGCNNEPGTYNATCQLCEYKHGPWTVPRNYECKRSQTYDKDVVDPAASCAVANKTETCQQVVLYGHKQKCFVHWDEKQNSLQRGCSSKKNMHPTAAFWECYGDYCNSDCIDMKCKVCDSESDPNCKANTKTIKEQKCVKGNFACFSCENKEGIVRRGCGFERSTNDEKCYHCFDEDACNRNTTRSCYKCTSTQDPDCARWENITKIEHELCASHDEACVVTKTAKYVVRGCEMATNECSIGDPDCKRCHGSLCNTGVYEHYRLPATGL